jgi:hypothetical protein
MRKHYDFSNATRGAALPSPGKTRITIMLDDDVLAHFRARAEAEGRGYQTLLNAALREAIADGRKATGAADARPLTVEVLRQVLREELGAG